MHPDRIQLNDTVKASPVGAGRITEITESGYPRVNNVAVAWLIRTDDAVFNPHDHDLSDALSNPIYTRAPS